MQSTAFLSVVDAVKEQVSVMDAVPHLIGALIVLATLAALWGVCALNAWLVRTLIPAPAALPANPGSAPAASPTSAATGIPPEIVAVVAAAIATASGKAHRIVSIKRQSTGWEKAGRQSVLTSHKIR